MYIHGTPYYLLSDKGSNVDGDTIREVCNAVGIEKRRSCGYHWQGNGFAERSIRHVKDILRSAILSHKLALYKWKSFLPEHSFALNTSVEMLLVYPPMLLYHVSDMRNKTSCRMRVGVELS